MVEKLQLSHGFSAVDTEEIAREQAENLRASIEPRLFSRGYYITNATGRHDWGELQLSHGFSAVDTKHLAQKREVYRWLLQLSHGFSAVDTVL